jgi:hypothetical protein
LQFPDHRNLVLGKQVGAIGDAQLISDRRCDAVVVSGQQLNVLDSLGAERRQGCWNLGPKHVGGCQDTHQLLHSSRIEKSLAPQPAGSGSARAPDPSRLASEVVAVLMSA